MSQMNSKNYTLISRLSSDLSHVETNILETHVLYFFIQKFEAFKEVLHSSVFHLTRYSYYLK